MTATGSAAPITLLRDAARSCRDCPLSTTRRQVVYGEGPQGSKLMIVGEAPGAHEDRSGRPFQGDAGASLDALLQWRGIRRSDVYIANTVMCRPPGNHPPQVAWIEACRRHLDDQITAVAPQLILSLGAIAARRLLGTRTTVDAARGRVHQTTYGPVIATYHPSPLSLRRQPVRRDAILADLLAVSSMLEGADPWPRTSPA